MAEIEDCIFDALGTVRHFLAETTGREPAPEEIADALKRYFVLKEIREHIDMIREEPDLKIGNGDNPVT